ncbi:GSCFA domain-containing protein [Adhaeribacter radiodurans]|uniref:GSCFA domain-containing protein n=1 Tax=Adhaeribacter radiodurans TaxID=2745197 RepID=A0A7L7L327_9BACT|nr:GSCFA domain-containing protein [Adhaeribacter radiodurans]QMU27194.1 GSCFA domain-containing protein [Adhaeribacter radiodurans]
MSTAFRTELLISPQTQRLSLQTPIFTAGSCFAEVIGTKMQQYKVPVLVNPYGTIFNPISLFTLLQASLELPPEFTGELIQRDDIWLAYDFHSSFSAPSRPELLTQIQKALTKSKNFLQNADTIVLTFGTAIGYIHRESNKLVANCHKIPQSQFTKHLLSIPDIISAFTSFYKVLQQFNPNIRIILTVSPVRHLKETLEGNSLSKSILRVVCHELKNQFAAVDYFPAYELLLDDLRDYRFYKPDMLHPTGVAEDYIWEKFKAAYFSEDFQHFTGKWDKIRQAFAHKPFQPASTSHQQFLKKILQQLEELQAQVDCQAEISTLKTQLITK